MTSLSPGVLFRATGFNDHSLPVERNVTADSIHRKYRKEPHLSGEWPQESPVAKVYNISHTSSRLVLLNNKANKYNNRLRGQAIVVPESANNSRAHSACSTRATSPNPDRHYYRESCTPDPEKHKSCVISETPRFQACPATPISNWWRNTKQRPPITFPNGSAVNEWHHYSCQVPSGPIMLPSNGPHHQPRSKSMPHSFRSSWKLQHPDLTPGHKRYLADTAHVYSVVKMKDLVQERYENLLYKQKVLEGARSKGFFSQEDYCKYLGYIQGSRKKLFSDTEYIERRFGSRPHSRTRSSPARVKSGTERSNSRASTPRSGVTSPREGSETPRSKSRAEDRHETERKGSAVRFQSEKNKPESRDSAASGSSPTTTDRSKTTATAKKTSPPQGSNSSKKQKEMKEKPTPRPESRQTTLSDFRESPKAEEDKATGILGCG
ncbi:uncharacterized protein LOC106175941 isoform X1 [Lingula anatina]|uniref:Uncharacterized protein LOC106175941 isoform X1 n=1 Tax=Lingula anatina TaxID=7574 RepID=A0A1S3JTC1_LINAN|nr:uncharacterized protein LOC106175941 isoform X1 [Lingula anatina]XP_013413588.1 uncharacterized protein LOC106175941 isoform X1 [Lingula anatina]XP_013413589.1 uncharacterized protein LOC106175941 isoform X1 [Lingula anatina]|eukprot:XP_013413587.1 uncharacterized protein LOC106175941 isoform X1 [Lingula anatina]